LDETTYYKEVSRMNGPHDVPQPIPYQGSKRQIAPAILRHFPATVSRLVEPFAGSAAISIALAARRRADRFWINDAHAPLIALWRQIIHRPDALARKYALLWNDQLGREREYFDQIRDQFNQEHDPADFLYLLARCVKAAIRYNANGEFNNTPDNRRKGARPTEMRRRILHASALLRKRTRLTTWDYKKVLNECTDEDLVYMDPPYQGVCGNRDQRYLPKVDHDRFCDELAKLNARNIMFSVSYDGRTGVKTYGEPLPDSLGLTHLEIRAGRSTQATLLGRNDVTYESLYLSPALIASVQRDGCTYERQLSLW
jgi:DNA adenine methylase